MRKNGGISLIKLLLRLFVKNYKDPNEPTTRAAVGKLSGVVGILCNVLLCGGKLIVGTLSGSVSITADAMNNLADSASSLVTLVGFKLAEKPADEDHPYGHARHRRRTAENRSPKVSPPGGYPVVLFGTGRADRFCCLKAVAVSV